MGDLGLPYLSAVFMSGLIASSLDYGLGLGFGLLATPILVVMGLDPRQAIAAALVAQVISSATALIAWRSHGAKPPSTDVLLVLIASSLAGVVLGSVFMSLLGDAEALAIYTVALAGIATLYMATATDSYSLEVRRLGRRPITILGGFLGGLSKALSGGGFSPILVASQRVSGVDYKASLVAIPLVKPLAFLAAAVIYSWAGYMEPYTAASLTAGSILGSLLAPRLSRLIPRRWAHALVGLALAAAMLKAVYRLTLEYGVLGRVGF
ncbi:conserved hypothetical protein [Aeropyrum pernix K1]|uniref:Probable membrane transporter protein n=1 Tax=Aeropyrum pernix (strain ATCC 700893 / DSM 11879 / JCM 9820 / NBRC 100138 / K1) TaxID=272557 RepID=Q9YCR5_AERPE|nr:sulfite exporter TauE/SafE family protein [Aeropyrum pernix]BAA80182.2 conserved hypothetical protein [Aeropyrum pernix K1]